MSHSTISGGISSAEFFLSKEHVLGNAPLVYIGGNTSGLGIILKGASLFVKC